MEPKIYTPFLNCGWKQADDTCGHPRNATPECHQFICPIKAVEQSVQADGNKVVLDGTFRCPECNFSEKHLASCSRR